MSSLRLQHVVLAGVLVFVGGLPTPGHASDRYAREKVIAKVEAGPDTLKPQPAGVRSAQGARRWRVGISLSALGFIRANKGTPLYGVQTQYRLRPRWWLYGEIGASKTKVNKYSYFLGNYRERLTLIPINWAATYYLFSTKGTQKKGYVTMGVSIFSAHSKILSPIRKGGAIHRWLFGPFVGIGVELPISDRVMNDIGVSYRGPINSFLKATRFTRLEAIGLKFSIVASL